MISVIMPVYNTEKYVSQAIESILIQTYRDLELIIIDDASTDDSLKILRSYEKRDPRIRILTNDSNQGISRARNLGLQLARGEYIAVMDSDDISLPDRFEKQIDYLTANPHVGVVGTNYTLVHENGIAHRTSKLVESSSQIWWMMFFSSAVAHATAMMRRSIFIDKKIKYDERYSCAVDYDLFFQIMHDYPMANLPESLFLYRQHDQNISKTNQSEQQAYDAVITRSHTQGYLPFQLPENYGSAVKDFRKIRSKRDAFSICRALTGIYRQAKKHHPGMTPEDKHFIRMDYSSKIFELWHYQLTNLRVIPYLFYALSLNKKLRIQLGEELFKFLRKI
ncbi:MAG: glycosyltransferase family 2 protein [Anaerolineales bacterium]|nr:glycosyltransferase family 2 protein [Anaerolineales bacterium]